MNELDEKLLPENSPIQSSGAVVPSFQFDSSNERNAVGMAKIKNFSFSAGTGGTLTLGGTTNGNGLMILNDASGSMVFKADYLGHHYYDTALGTTEQIKVDWDGLHAYGTAGTSVEQIKLDNTGLHSYNTSGTEIIKVDGTGFKAYTSTGLKQIQVDVDGFHGYDVSSVERIKIDEDGLHAYNSSSKELVTLEEGGLIVRDSSENTTFAQVSNGMVMGKQKLFAFRDRAGELKASVSFDYNDSTLVNSLLLQNENNGPLDYAVGGTIFEIMSSSGVKTAIVPTTKGYCALYTNESPEVWFMDFCKKVKTWKFWKKLFEVDPLFLEVTSPPYHFIKCKDGEYQVWGKRKGFENTRFEKKTKKQFEKNNKFWNTPNYEK